jgi:hypothetical protein
MNTIEAIDTPTNPGRGVLIVPKWDEGDFRSEWDHKNSDQTEAARKQFIDLKAKGYKAFRIDPKSSEKGEVLKEFDPKAEKIIMVPPFAGG